MATHTCPKTQWREVQTGWGSPQNFASHGHHSSPRTWRKMCLSPLVQLSSLPCHIHMALPYPLRSLTLLAFPVSHLTFHGPWTNAVTWTDHPEWVPSSAETSEDAEGNLQHLPNPPANRLGSQEQLVMLYIGPLGQCGRAGKHSAAVGNLQDLQRHMHQAPNPCGPSQHIQTQWTDATTCIRIFFTLFW